MAADTENEDTSAGERRAGLERLVKDYRATRKRHLLEFARKLRIRIERRRGHLERDEPPLKSH
jgi:hypothetical protein